MNRLFVIIAAVATILFAAHTCARASETPTPPPFAFKIIHLEDLRLNYGAQMGASRVHKVDYSQTLKPVKFEKTCVPGRIPTFPFVAVISAVGTYTLYGAGAGPVTAAIIYIATDGNRKHTRQAIWGCVTGMVVGGVAKWLSVR